MTQQLLHYLQKIHRIGPAPKPRSANRMSDKPRVGIISPSWTVGGVERWFLSLCKGCPDIQFVGVAVTEVSTSNLIDPALVAETLAYCPVHFAPHGEAELLRECDIVIVWGTDPSPFLRKFTGKVVVVSHGMGEWTRQRLTKLVPLASQLCAVSRWAVTPYAESVRDRVLVMHNGVDYDRITPRRPRAATRKDWGLAPDALAVGYIGRWSAEKNPSAAAVAASKLSYATAVYQCPPRSRQYCYTELPKLCSRHYVSTATEVADFYSAVDVIVMASEQEGFCLSIIEAWAAGVPVVATDVGAISEMEEVYGQLVVRVEHNAEPWDLAVAVQTAVGPQFRTVVDRAKVVAWNNFSASTMCYKWSRLFHSLLP